MNCSEPIDHFRERDSFRVRVVVEQGLLPVIRWGNETE
jgi:hypothetical protein